MELPLIQSDARPSVNLQHPGLGMAKWDGIVVAWDDVVPDSLGIRQIFLFAPVFSSIRSFYSPVNLCYCMTRFSPSICITRVFFLLRSLSCYTIIDNCGDSHISEAPCKREKRERECETEKRRNNNNRNQNEKGKKKQKKKKNGKESEKNRPRSVYYTFGLRIIVLISYYAIRPAIITHTIAI